MTPSKTLSKKPVPMRPFFLSTHPEPNAMNSLLVSGETPADALLRTLKPEDYPVRSFRMQGPRASVRLKSGLVLTALAVHAPRP